MLGAASLDNAQESQEKVNKAESMQSLRGPDHSTCFVTQNKAYL